MPPRKARPRVVLDTNIIIAAALSKRGAPYQLINLWKRGFLQLVVSPAIVNEYLAVLRRFDLSERQLQAWQNWFEHPAKVDFVPEPCRVRVSRDLKDDVFVGTALTGRVTTIISGDDDLLSLERVENVEIITPAAFMRRWRAAED